MTKWAGLVGRRPTVPTTSHAATEGDRPVECGLIANIVAHQRFRKVTPDTTPGYPGLRSNRVRFGRTTAADRRRRQNPDPNIPIVTLSKGRPRCTTFEMETPRPATMHIGARAITGGESPPRAGSLRSEGGRIVSSASAHPARRRAHRPCGATRGREAGWAQLAYPQGASTTEASRFPGAPRPNTRG